VDPPGSVFYECFKNGGDRSVSPPAGEHSVIEGIGRSRVEPSFVPEVIDAMVKVPDAASLAGMRFLDELTGYDGTQVKNIFFKNYLNTAWRKHRYEFLWLRTSSRANASSRAIRKHSFPDLR